MSQPSKEQKRPAEEGVLPDALEEEEDVEALEFMEDKEDEPERAHAVEVGDGGDADDDEDEYEWSDWDEVEEEEVRRPERLTPILGGGVSKEPEEPEEPEEELVASSQSGHVEVRLESVGRYFAVAAVVVLLSLAVGGAAYLGRELIRLVDRVEQLESGVAGAGETSTAAVAPATAEEEREEGEGGGGEPVAVTAEAGESDEGKEGTEKESPEAAVDLGEVEERVGFLERRSKLTMLADQAISGGSRFAFKQLEDEFENPGMEGMKVAANSEIIRVESIYARAAGMPYPDIPMELLDPALKSDEEMSVRQLGDILVSSSVPPEARARAVQLLATQPSYESCLLVVECIRTEPNLAVLVEATLTFKKLTGYSASRVFAGKGAERWFAANKDVIRAGFERAALAE